MHNQTGSKNPNWRGGKTVKDGYIVVRCEGHPHAMREGFYVPEHDLIMEKHIGRYLRPGEIVHHINHNRKDNRLENLQLMTVEEHMRYHGKKGALKATRDKLGRFQARLEILLDNEQSSAQL
jgi:hypothetical protein